MITMKEMFGTYQGNNILRDLENFLRLFLIFSRKSPEVWKNVTKLPDEWIFS